MSGSREGMEAKGRERQPGRNGGTRVVSGSREGMEAKGRERQSGRDGGHGLRPAAGGVEGQKI